MIVFAQLYGSRTKYFLIVYFLMFIVMVNCSNTTTILGGGELIATTF